MRRYRAILTFPNACAFCRFCPGFRAAGSPRPVRPSFHRLRPPKVLPVKEIEMAVDTTEIKSRLSEVEDLIARTKDASRFDELEVRLKELAVEMEREGFWDDPEAAKPVISELKRNKGIVDKISGLEGTSGGS